MAHNSSVLSSVFIVLIHVVVERGVFGCFGQEESTIGNLGMPSPSALGKQGPQISFLPSHTNCYMLFCCIAELVVPTRCTCFLWCKQSFGDTVQSRDICHTKVQAFRHNPATELSHLMNTGRSSTAISSIKMLWPRSGSEI